MLMKAADTVQYVSVILYGVSLCAVYVMSSVYHFLPCCEAKRRARLFDHCMVPLLIAGTATPCSLLILSDISIHHGLFVLIVSWSCTAFGIFTRLFFFEKLKNLTVGVYIVSGIMMFVSVIPVMQYIKDGIFEKMLSGSALYLTGAVFCLMGVRRPWLHVIFHLFVLAGSAVHFYAVYTYML